MARRPWSGNDEITLEQYKRMVYKLAFKSWRQLPASVKMWVSPEDLVADAYLYILTSAKFSYRKRRAGRSTFLWVGVSNLYLNFALRHQAKKRFGWRVPLEDIQWCGQQDTQIAQRESLEALSRIYWESSEACRDGIRKWFGQEPVKARKSVKEKRVYEEFFHLAKKNGLTREACRELMRGGVWVP